MISKKDFSEITFRFPNSKSEQSAIAQVLSDMDSEISDLEAKRDKYKSIKQGMMSELLTGNIRLL
jgi:type I restriction enzyme S subunit